LWFEIEPRCASPYRWHCVIVFVRSSKTGMGNGERRHFRVAASFPERVDEAPSGDWFRLRRTSPSCVHRWRYRENRRYTNFVPPLRAGVLVLGSRVGRLLHCLGLSHKKHCRLASRNAQTSVRRARCRSGRRRFFTTGLPRRDGALAMKSPAGDRQWQCLDNLHRPCSAPGY